MKIAITGGHFSPAYCLIKAFSKDADFVVIGRQFTFEGDSAVSLEYKLAQHAGIPFYHLNTGRFQRKFSVNTIPSLLKFPGGIFQSLSILRRERPDIVMTFGGYLSVPVAIAARILSIPVVVHEQTQHAGLANKVIAPFARKVLISFLSSRPLFPKDKTIMTGNPVRDEIFTVAKGFDIDLSKPLIYITGGSSGAHAINESVEGIIGELLEHYSVLHQTGDAQEFKDFDRLSAIRDRLPMDQKKRYVLTKFVFPDQIGWVFKHARLAISRSGINTVHELIACKKPSLLIPLPYGQNNEQLNNARLMEKIGLASVIEQKDLSSDRLLDSIHSIFENYHTYEVKTVDPQYYQKDAIQNIMKVLLEIHEKKTTNQSS